MIEFTKMSGAGNDFIVFDNRSGDITGEIGAVARRLCTRGLSVGADGVILVEKARSAADVRMVYWNSDGGRAGFCANGTRCVARYAIWKGFCRGPRVKIETDSGLVDAEVLADDSVRIPMPSTIEVVLERPINVDALPLTGSYAVSGVPHYVLTVRNLAANAIEDLGRKIRRHPEFAPDGVNVDFVTVASPSNVDIRTYERGVERETLACGSGCVASALVLARKGEVTSPVSLRTRSGLDLVVSFTQEEERFTGVTLTGDARIIFTGFLADEAASGFPEPVAAAY